MPLSRELRISPRHRKQITSLDPLHWSPNYLAILNIRVDHGALFNHTNTHPAHDIPECPPTNTSQLDPVRWLWLSTAGIVGPCVVGIQESTELYLLFRESHVLAKSYGRQHSAAAGYAQTVISYLFSEIIADEYLVYADLKNGKQSEL
jgi:hypothetical protein